MRMKGKQMDNKRFFKIRARVYLSMHTYTIYYCFLDFVYITCVIFNNIHCSVAFLNLVYSTELEEGTMKGE